MSAGSSAIAANLKRSWAIEPDIAAGRARAALNADGVAVLRSEPVGYSVLISDCEGDFDVLGTISAAHFDIIARTRRTLIPTTQHGIVLVPVVSNGALVGALHVVRAGDAVFSEQEVRDIEAIAAELEIPRARERSPSVGLRRETVMDLMGLDSHSSVVWLDDEWDATEPILDEPSPAKTLVAFGQLAPSRFITDEGLRDMLAKTVTEVLETTQGHVVGLVLDGEPIRVLALAAAPEAPDLPPAQLISTSIVRRVIESALPVLTLDANQDLSGAPSRSILNLSVATVLCVPLTTSANQTIGVLYSATFNFSGKFDHKTLEALMADARALGPMLHTLEQA